MARNAMGNGVFGKFTSQKLFMAHLDQLGPILPSMLSAVQL
jgi:hypothetical protein